MNKQLIKEVIESIVSISSEEKIDYENKHKESIDKIKTLDMSDKNTDIDKTLDQLETILLDIRYKDDFEGLSMLLSKLELLGYNKKTKLKFESFGDGMLTYWNKKGNKILEITLLKDHELFSNETIESLFDFGVEKISYCWCNFYIDELKQESFDFSNQRITRFKDNQF